MAGGRGARRGAARPCAPGAPEWTSSGQAHRACHLGAAGLVPDARVQPRPNARQAQARVAVQRRRVRRPELAGQVPRRPQRRKEPRWHVALAEPRRKGQWASQRRPPTLAGRARPACTAQDGPESPRARVLDEARRARRRREAWRARRKRRPRRRGRRRARACRPGAQESGRLEPGVLQQLLLQPLRHAHDHQRPADVLAPVVVSGGRGPQAKRARRWRRRRARRRPRPKADGDREVAAATKRSEPQ